MKNIHMLPTDKPSKLYKNLNGKLSFTDIEFEQSVGFTTNQHIYITNSEEIKKGDWVYYENGDLKGIHKVVNGQRPKTMILVKIVLTTDQELINDGVQAIDNEFLEWFVAKANDSGKPIDIVEVEKEIYEEILGDDFFKKVNYYTVVIAKQENYAVRDGLIGKKVIWDGEEYIIIDKHNNSDMIMIDDMNHSIIGLSWDNVCIPKEEPKLELQLSEEWNPNEQIMDFKQETLEEEKLIHSLFVSETEEELLREFEGESDEEINQETLEEAAERLTIDYYGDFYSGAKWQKEQDLSMVQGYLSANLQNIELLKRSYSEEEVLNLFKEFKNKFSLYRNIQILNREFYEWFEQFKNK